MNEQRKRSFFLESAQCLKMVKSMEMKLNKKQFDILVELEREGKPETQRLLAQRTGFSLGIVNKCLNELTQAGLLAEGVVTEDGLAALEPYRVQRAVILAAGFGARLVPVTLNTPKPLVRVKGKRIIDSLLDALTEAQIPEIYIVRGYLAEQFDQLRYKYPNIRFIDNPDFNEANNISSAMYARHLMRNAYVCEADLLVSNPRLITKYQYQSNYLGVPVEQTNDWCFYSRRGIITELRIGGENCHHMFGISYWTGEDGEKLEKSIEYVYHRPGGRERYWDQVPLEYCIDQYKVAIRECSFDDIVEIDTYRELKEIDHNYI